MANKWIILCLLLAIISSIFAYEPIYVSNPVVSPDGEYIIFEYLDDIWEVPFTGGVARRLTANQGQVSYLAYSPDGQWVSFSATKGGEWKYYRMPRQGGEAEVISHESFSFYCWFPDGKSLLISKGYPSAFMKLDIGGQRPQEIVAYSGTFATLSADATKIAFSIRGLPYRPTYQGSSKGDIWLYDVAKGDFQPLIEAPYTARYPLFSTANPNRLYFCESDSQRFQIYYIDNLDPATKTQITHLTHWSARKPSIARANDRIAFEYFNQIYTYNPTTQQCQKLNIDIRENNIPYPIITNTYINNLTKATISPNGDLLVFSHKFDLFAVPVKGGDVKQITFDHKGIDEIAIFSDNETIYFTSWVQGLRKLFRVNINNLSDIKMEQWSQDKYIQGLASQDGEVYIVYDQDDKRLKFATIDMNQRIIEIIPNETLITTLYQAKDGSKLIYSRYYHPTGTSTIYIKDQRANTAQGIFQTTTYINNVIMDESEKVLFYSDWSNIYSVQFTNEKEAKEDNWATILQPTTAKDKAKPATLPWDITQDNFLIRRKQLPNTNQASPMFATADSTLFYYSQQALKSIKFDGSSEEEVFKFGGNPDFVYLSDDRGTLYYILKEQLHKLNIKTKKSEQVTFEFDYSYDTVKLNESIIEQVWGNFAHNFYDPNMHNQDWAAIYKEFAPFAKNILSTTQLSVIAEEMVGRLNASHTGFTPRNDGHTHTPPTANIGANFDYATRLNKGIRLKDVYYGSELHQKYQVKEGDILLAVNDVEITPDTVIDAQFKNKVDKDIKLKIQTSAGIINADIKGLTWTAHYQLVFEDRVRKSYQQVQKATNGKVGYLRIRGMGRRDLAKFEQDFLALNRTTEAMIIDVRGNGGGRISGELFDIITRTHRGYNTSRQHPEPYLFPQNVYQRPVICLIDEDSYSDAEIFGTLFHDLGVGLVIGMPTSGSVIGTSEVRLMDGSSMRMPSHGWFRSNKENMELTGAKPDIYVPRLPQHIVRNEDPQLDKAIDEALKLIK